MSFPGMKISSKILMVLFDFIKKYFRFYFQHFLIEIEPMRSDILSCGTTVAIQKQTLHVNGVG